MQTRICVVLLSGGLDSTVALWWAIKKEKYDEIHALTFLYGSREEKVTKNICRKIVDLSGVTRHCFVELPWLRKFSIKTMSTLVEGGETPPTVTLKDLSNNEKLRETAISVWIPARNLCFISIAASYAEAISSRAEIITGFNEEEAKTFPDNSPEFIDRMNALLEVSTLKAKVTLRAPLINLDKREICNFARELGVPVERSNSCYNPLGITEDGKPIHCGVCESCIRRKRAFMESWGFDPTIYG